MEIIQDTNTYTQTHRRIFALVKSSDLVIWFLFCQNLRSVILFPSVGTSAPLHRQVAHEDKLHTKTNCTRRQIAHEDKLHTKTTCTRKQFRHKLKHVLIACMLCTSKFIRSILSHFMAHVEWYGNNKDIEYIRVHTKTSRYFEERGGHFKCKVSLSCKMWSLYGELF